MNTSVGYYLNKATYLGASRDSAQWELRTTHDTTLINTDTVSYRCAERGWVADGDAWFPVNAIAFADR